MKLIDILVRELPGLGGWPPGADSLYQNAKGRLVDTRGCIVNTVYMTLSVVAENTHRSVTREQYEAALAASKTEWGGEGVPPVGCECEFYDCEAWHVVHVKFIGDKYAVLQDLKFDVERVYCVADKPDKFRPIRTEADQKREEAETALRTCLAGTGAGITPLAAKCIYDSILNKEIPHIRID